MADQLMARMEEYLRGKMSLDDLSRWLVVNLQFVLDSGDREAILLANAIDVGLIGLSEGLMTRDEFDDKLRSLAREQKTIAVGERDVLSVASTGSRTMWAFADNLMPVENLRHQCSVA